MYCSHVDVPEETQKRFLVFSPKKLFVVAEDSLCSSFCLVVRDRPPNVSTKMFPLAKTSKIFTVGPRVASSIKVCLFFGATLQYHQEPKQVA